MINKLLLAAALVFVLSVAVACGLLIALFFVPARTISLPLSIDALVLSLSNLIVLKAALDD